MYSIGWAINQRYQQHNKVQEIRRIHTVCKGKFVALIVVPAALLLLLVVVLVVVTSVAVIFLYYDMCYLRIWCKKTELFLISACNNSKILQQQI